MQCFIKHKNDMLFLSRPSLALGSLMVLTKRVDDFDYDLIIISVVDGI